MHIEVRMMYKGNPIEIIKGKCPSCCLIGEVCDTCTLPRQQVYAKSFHKGGFVGKVELKSDDNLTWFRLRQDCLI
jgi:hypothetical protein